MPYTESRRARERRLRARYRRKTAVTAIIMLILGLIVGFVLCVVSGNSPLLCIGCFFHIVYLYSCLFHLP